MKKRAFFIASTGQHVGKTTTCLGLLSGLRKRFTNIGFMKPVGQEHEEIGEGIKVDKDVILFKEYFDLAPPYQLMSPVIFPRGFTREYLDGKIHEKQLKSRILHSFHEINEGQECTVVEGTGHVGVGSIVNLNNAIVAKHLEIPVVLIAPAGLGSSFDSLALNKMMCDAHGVQVVGVILNRIQNEKRKMVIDYMSKALSRWKIPLLGAIPYDSFLSSPCMKDFESLFQTKLLSGQKHRLRHFDHRRLVATSNETYRELMVSSQLIITPATREDIILTTLIKHREFPLVNSDAEFESGMILTGSTPPSKEIVQQLKEAGIPMLYAKKSSFTAMQMITSHIAKIRKEDTEKVQEAISVVEEHLDFDTLLASTSR